jgi:SAM-dependent methyltransferase
VGHRYSAEAVRAFYDEAGEREWHYHFQSVADRVGIEIHRRFLQQWIRPGCRVLEIGAGPGRFTIEMARSGARILVCDISPRQLELNAQMVGEAGVESSVEGRELVDIVDLSRYFGERFDVVLAYGGQLSYVFERAASALDQMLRVAGPAGTVVLSVMSRWGTLRNVLGSALELERTQPRGPNWTVIETGDLVGDAARVPGVSLPHECHLFTWPELNDLQAEVGCHLVAASASSFLATGSDVDLAALQGPALVSFFDWEEMACRQPGALEAGTRIIVAARR